MSERMQFKRRAFIILIIICFQAFNMSYCLSCSWEISHCDHEEVVCTDQESVVLNGKNPTVKARACQSDLKIKGCVLQL